jgi:hypothetical protein
MNFNVAGDGFSTSCHATPFAFTTLVSIPQTNCTDTSVSFLININGTQANLEVFQEVADVVYEQDKYFPEGTVVTYEDPFNPNGNYQYMETAANFTMGN